jgi:L-iditol 2-dehydrogenase
MKQAIMVNPGRIEIRQTTVPQPGPRQVLLRIHCIGVCGSDIHVYHGKHPYTSYPVVQGHEFSASVEAVGNDVAGITPGMKVTAMPQIVCGECVPCRRGDYHICDKLKVQGFQAPGCAQEFWVTDVEQIVPLPALFTYEQGAMIEPIAVAVHAVARAGDLDGHRVAVLGGGPIGNLVAQVARSNGAHILITDLSPYRLDVARRCGLSATANPAEEDLGVASARVFGACGFDVAFECVGIEATMTEAIANLAKGGTLVVVGVFGEKPRVDLGLVQDRELNLRGTLMYQRQDYERAAEWVGSGKVLTEPLMSKHFTLDHYLDAYRFIDEQRDRTMKVFIDLTP